MTRPGRAWLANLVGGGMLLYIILSSLWTLIAGAVVRQPWQPVWTASLFQLIFVPLTLVPPILLVGVRGRRAGLRLPLGRGKIPIYILLPLFLGLMVAVNSCANLLRSLLTQGMELPAAESALLPEDGTARVLYFLTACVLAPVLEELFFRGAIQGALRPYGTVLSIVLSSLLFTFAHSNLWELPVVFVLGFIIGYVAEVSGSLLPGIILHAANNIAMFLILLEQEQIGGIATLALAFWMVVLFVALFLAAAWTATKQKMWPKFRLRKRAAPQADRVQKAATKSAARRGKKAEKPPSALRRLLNQPVFLVGGLAMAAYCLIRLFTG